MIVARNSIRYMQCIYLVKEPRCSIPLSPEGERRRSFAKFLYCLWKFRETRGFSAEYTRNLVPIFSIVSRSCVPCKLYRSQTIRNQLPLFSESSATWIAILQQKEIQTQDYTVPHRKIFFRRNYPIDHRSCKKHDNSTVLHTVIPHGWLRTPKEISIHMQTVEQR
jgi:hypothetical protein